MTGRHHLPPLFGLLLLSVVVTATTASGASAQETEPPTTGPQVPIVVPAPTPVVPVDEDLDEIRAADTNGGCATSGSTAVEELVPEGCWGRYPSSSYDIGCDEGAWNHLSRKVYCTFTDLAFQGGRTATAVAAWLAGWAYSFDAASLITDPALSMARAFDTRIVGPLDLGAFAWFLMVAWVALTALRGRVTHAAGEFITSALLAGLAGIMLANPAGYLTGTFDTMSRLSTVTLASGTGHAPPSTPDESGMVVAPIQAELHHSFVEDPYDVLNWGTTTMDAGCERVRDQIVATGPHGSDDAPRDAMDDAGCEELAEFNHEPTAQRLFGAFLAFVAAVIMAVLVGLVALTVVVAQLAVAVAFIALPFAAALAVLPGSGRGLAVRWMTMVLRSILAMVGMSFLLAVMLMLIQALLAGSDSMPMFARFALVDVAVVVAILARKRLITAGHGFAAGIGAAAASARPGSGTGGPRRPSAPAHAAGVSGFGLAAGASSGPPGRMRRGAQTVGRYKLQERAYSRRAGQTHAIEHSQVSAAGARARTTSVSGPAPTTRRARRARSRVEHRASRNSP
ncbi:MAG: type IV secretion system protein [Acidimicrobiales bacterium]|nr:type IV secretion system protein [Acidimicrobiales bacterium]